MIRALPQAELRRFADWWEAHRRTLLADSAHENPPTDESEAVKAELLRRRQEYKDHPERFTRMDDESLDRMFREIEDEAP